MKRFVSLALLALGLLAPVALVGCGGSDDASKPIKTDAAKPADKAPAK